MKIDITKTVTVTKFYANDGQELDLGATSVSIHASIHHPTRAEIELVFVESTTYTDVSPVYMVGKYTGVKGLVLDSGEIVYLPEKGD